MWQSQDCEGGATVPLPLVGDKSCERARGRLLDRLDVRQAQVSRASHKVTGWVLFQPNSLYTTPHTPVGQSSLTDQQSNNGMEKSSTLRRAQQPQVLTSDTVLKMVVTQLFKHGKHKGKPNVMFRYKHKRPELIAKCGHGGQTYPALLAG